MHSFAYASERAFQAIAVADPTCANGSLGHCDVLFPPTVESARSCGLEKGARGDGAGQLLRHAADEEEALEKLPVTPGPIVPAREQLGEMLLTRGRPREALQEFRMALVAAPRRRAALTGAIQAAELVGDRPMAEKMRADLASE